MFNINSNIKFDIKKFFNSKKKTRKQFILHSTIIFFLSIYYSPIAKANFFNEKELANIDKNSLTLQYYPLQILEEILDSIAIARTQYDDNNPNLFSNLYDKVNSLINQQKLQEVIKKEALKEKKPEKKSPKEETEKKVLTEKPIKQNIILKENLIDEEIIKNDNKLTEKSNFTGINIDKKYIENLFESLDIENPKNYFDDFKKEKEAFGSFLLMPNNKAYVHMTIKEKFIKKNNKNSIENILKALDKIRISKTNKINNNKINNNKINNDELHKEPQILNIDIHTKETIEKTIESIINSEYKNLCLFDECRCLKDTIRLKFENDIIDNKHLNKAENINYLGIGSGQLLPDIIILLRLIKNGKKIKNIHLIDPYYSVAITALLRIGKSIKNINLNNSINEINFYSNLLLEALKPDLSKDLKKYADNKTMSSYIFAQIFMLSEFLNILSQAQGEPINLYAYKGISSYIKICKKEDKQNKKLNRHEYETIKANLITIIDPVNFSEGAIKDIKNEDGLIKGESIIGENNKEIITKIEEI